MPQLHAARWPVGKRTRWQLHMGEQPGEGQEARDRQAVGGGMRVVTCVYRMYRTYGDPLFNEC